MDMSLLGINAAYLQRERFGRLLSNWVVMLNSEAWCTSGLYDEDYLFVAEPIGRPASRLIILVFTKVISTFNLEDRDQDRGQSPTDKAGMDSWSNQVAVERSLGSTYWPAVLSLLLHPSPTRPSCV